MKREARAAARTRAVRRGARFRTVLQPDAGWPRPWPQRQAGRWASRACAQAGCSSRKPASDPPAGKGCARCPTHCRTLNVRGTSRRDGGPPHGGRRERAKPSARALPSGLPAIPTSSPISGRNPSAYVRQFNYSVVDISAAPLCHALFPDSVHGHFVALPEVSSLHAVRRSSAPARLAQTRRAGTVGFRPGTAITRPSTLPPGSPTIRLVIRLSIA